MKLNKGYLGFVLVMFLAMGAGCASTHQTTTTKTTMQYPNREDAQVEQKSTESTADQSSQPVVTESTTTTTSTETKPEQIGIIGGALRIVGSIIAFPFICIGGLLRMIF